MAGLVDGYGALLVGGHHLGLLLQTADDAVYGVEEVLLAHMGAVVTGGDEGSLVADIGDVGAGKSGGMAGKEVYVYGVVLLQRAQVDIEDGLSLSQVGQVYVYLTVETACTEQCLVEHVYSVGGSEHDNT